MEWLVIEYIPTWKEKIDSYIMNSFIRLKFQTFAITEDKIKTMILDMSNLLT